DGAFPFARIAGAVVALSVITATYVIIIFTAIKIWIEQTHINVSEKTRRLRKQLVVVMLLQALLPLLLVILPMILLVILTEAKISVREYATIAAMLFNWEPCAHPFIALYFVAPFRKRICRFFQTNHFCTHRKVGSSNPTTLAYLTIWKNH
uniref:G_PROTEIN_RECEP_F1_2 domain-containing protein n=1 Tax=Ascaris lumbricoides TaxID=6252 RepID=A0A0M3IS83_ASCLU